MFEDYAAVHRVTQGTIGRELMRRLSGTGLKALTFWDNGFKQVSANRPLVLPDDFRGLRMRIQGSEVIEAQMRALGAYSDPMALSDVYAALQRGVVDGTENTASNYFTQRMYEVQRYLTISNHGYLGYVVIVNERFWRGLPAGLADTLTEALSDATKYANAIANSENETALDRIRALGTTQIIELSDAQRATWKAALFSVRDAYVARAGERFLLDVERVNAAAAPARS